MTDALKVQIQLLKQARITIEQLKTLSSTFPKYMYLFRKIVGEIEVVLDLLENVVLIDDGDMPYTLDDEIESRR